MRTVVWLLVLALAILHYDFWLWDDQSLLFGFMPVGLAYHAGLSAASGIVWAMAVKFAWPARLEEWAQEADSPERAS